MMEGAPGHSTGLGGETNGALRRLALAGVTGPIVFWMVVHVLGFVTLGYSVVSSSVSDQTAPVNRVPEVML